MHHALNDPQGEDALAPVQIELSLTCHGYAALPNCTTRRSCKGHCAADCAKSLHKCVTQCKAGAHGRGGIATAT